MSLYRRIHMILTVTGRPTVVFWWGVALELGAVVVVWADFITLWVSLVFAPAMAGIGMLFILQSGDLQRRRDGKQR